MAGSTYKLFVDRFFPPLSTRRNNRMTRLSLAALILCLVLVTVRCAQPGASTTVTYVSYWKTTPYSSVDKELVKRFQEAYPQVNVDRSWFLQWGVNLLNRSAPPDVMTWNATVMYPLGESQDLFLDIGDLWEQQGWEEVVPGGLQVLSQNNGRYVFLPTHLFWNGLFYNKALFERYDLTPPETWDEFLEVCTTLKQNDVPPIAIGLSIWDDWQAALWFDYLNIRINGLGFRDDLLLEGQVSFDDPRVRAVFTTLQPLVDDGYFDEDARHRTSDGAVKSVLDGKAAMTLVGQDDPLKLSKTEWNEVGVFRFPIIDPSIPLGETPGIEGFVISANASEPQAAMDFLAYRGSAEAQAYWAEGCGPVGGVPARSDVDSAGLTPLLQDAQEICQDTDELGQFFFWTDSPMVDPISSQRYFVAFFDDPEALDEILDKMEAKRQEIFGE
jgi:ABC-type glycerol-3-phosphate transport system substrate-binding protein